jgi:hypothetical protein
LGGEVFADLLDVSREFMVIEAAVAAVFSAKGRVVEKRLWKAG